MPEDPTQSNPFYRRLVALGKLLDAPVTWFRENIVVSNREEYPYYHRRYNRVPTIDECYLHDAVCMDEAEKQWRRDREVDRMVIILLRERYTNCVRYQGIDNEEMCHPFREKYEAEAKNYFTKYGDMRWIDGPRECYWKQKHRMIWERRHGEIGTGMRPQ